MQQVYFFNRPQKHNALIFVFSQQKLNVIVSFCGKKIMFAMTDSYINTVDQSSGANTLIALSTIAERIKQVRGGELQKNFAERIGCNVNTLRSYEKGLANPNFEFIQVICETEKISPQWLIFGSGSMRLNGDLPEMTQQAGKQTEAPDTAGLRRELDEERHERRELAAENRQLLKENAEIRERLARLEEQARAARPPQNTGDMCGVA